MEELKKEPVTAVLILVNLAVFMLTEFTGGSENTIHMLKWGAAYTPLIVEQGESFRLFTSMFLHFGMTHLANNMLVLFVLGQRLEPLVGKLRFLLIYLLGGIGGNVISLQLDIRRGDGAVSAGASGAVFALMGAMIYVLLRNKGKAGDISIRQILVMTGFSIYLGFAGSGVDNAAHVGGLLCGFFLAVVLYHARVMQKAEP